VVRLGALEMVNTKVIEDLFSADFNALQQLYNRINYPDENAGQEFGGEAGSLGKSASVLQPISSMRI
jgi:hypothetical protein